MGGRKTGRSSGLVYSTEYGRMCTTCGQPSTRCRCRGTTKPTGSNPKPTDGVIKVERQTKGRKGKGVTLLRGVPLAGAELAQLTKRLKKLCGSGGTLKDGVVEIQGDHRDRLVDELVKLGFKAKKAGG